MSRKATWVSMASNAVPKPALLLTTSLAPVAMMSVPPSPASCTPALLISRSPVLVVRSLPSVIRPPALKLILPLPALMTVRSSMTMAPVPALSVTLPEVDVMSPWAPSVMPAAAFRLTMPLTVVMAWFSVKAPLLVDRFRAALPLRTSVLSMVKAPALARVMAAPPVLSLVTSKAPVLLRLTTSPLVVTSRLLVLMLPVTVSPAMILMAWALAVTPAAKVTFPVVWIDKLPIVPVSVVMLTSPVVTRVKLPPAISTSASVRLPV